MSARKNDKTDCVPWTLPDGDKTYVQLVATEEVEGKSKPRVGTLYTVIKPLEKAAAKKGTALSITSYGKVEAKGQAGKHSFGFEFPDNHPKHVAQDYFLNVSKAAVKATNSGHVWASLAVRDGWAGACTPMWRLAHDPVRSSLHARKPVAIVKENVSLKKGVPMKVMWLKQGLTGSAQESAAVAAEAGSGA